MFSSSAATLPVLLVGLIIGMAALVLVTHELGRRVGLTTGGRLILASGLGMGILAVAIKVTIITALAQVDGKTLARAGTAARISIERWLPDTAEAAPTSKVNTRPSGFRTWRALPDTPKSPRNNPATPEKVALGQALFYDPNLSLDRTVSCASCHGLADGGDDNARVSTGIQGLTGDRNAPTVLNAAFLSRLFWDGRASSLEAQAAGPFVNPVEMAMPTLTAVEKRVAENAQYQQEFDQVFGGPNPITIRNITRAIAAYERTLVTPDTPYDRFVKGDNFALSPSALRGMALFDEVGCRNCHLDPVFSSAGTVKPMGTYRRFPVHTKNNPFLSKYGLLIDGESSLWRVPSLRNVALTAPYFHNGSVDDLKEAIRIMAVSQLGRVLSDDPQQDIVVQAVSVDGAQPGRNLGLIRDRAVSEAEIADIAAFLRSLTATSLPKDLIRAGQ